MSRTTALLMHLTSEWEGEPVGDSRLIRILNPAGRRTPLIWCYNSTAEFPAMARGLGPDQPLIGIRSLHLVTPNGPNRYADDERTAELYADALLASGLDLDGCAIGGNCQGGGIAFHLAAQLLLAGLRVPTLILMEMQSPLPFPGTVGLIYGAQSEMFNPFLRGEQPEAKWARLFHRPVVEIIPGAHGEYFTDENYQTSCNAIARILEHGAQAPLCADVQGAMALELVDPPQIARAAQPLELVVRPCADAVSCDEPMVMHYLWASATDGLREAAETPVWAASAGGPDRPVRIAVEAPELAGDWEFRLFLCREAGGPVAWKSHNARRYRLKVV